MIEVNYGLILVCLVLIVFIGITDSIAKKRKHLLSSMTIATMVLIIADNLASAYNGSPTGGYVVRISKFMAYAMNLCIIFTFTQYLKNLLQDEVGLDATPSGLNAVSCILAAGLVVLVVSQFTGLYYIYDENNFYHKGKFYFGSYIFALSSLVVLIFIIARFRRKLRRRLLVPLLLFTTMPIVTAVIHFFIHEYTLTSAAIVAMTVVLYCFSIMDANETIKAAHKKEIENEKLMLSQTAEALAEAIDAKDAYTSGHSNRVAKYSVMIARRAGKSKEECEKIYLIALLHDVGKIGVPGSIINKPGRLTDEEYEIIKTHPIRGKEILEKISIFPELAIGAHYHHERYDGKGYPEGLKGEEIPEIARIIAVADTYDAMTSKRSYRDGLPLEIVREELVNGMGTQFDARYAKIMIDLLEESKPKDH